MPGASLREVSAEFLGTFVLMFFGLGVNAQVTLGKAEAPTSQHHSITQYDHGDWFSINAGWGLAVIFGVYVAGGITGAHINPAVTLAMAVRKRLPWKKVAPYVLAQLAGAFLASLLIYLVYYEAINVYERGVAAQEVASTATDDAPRTMATAGIWATYPRQFSDDTQLSLVGGLTDQILGTAMLLLCIFALVDKRNMAPQSNMGPLLVGGVVFMIGMSFGSNCGYAINPARDFGPRLFTYVAGWGGQVFEVHNGLWWLVPIVGPCIGAVLGAVVYEFLIERFHDKSELDGQ